jgi:hypothetical protein
MRVGVLNHVHRARQKELKDEGKMEMPDDDAKRERKNEYLRKWRQE